MNYKCLSFVKIRKSPKIIKIKTKHPLKNEKNLRLQIILNQALSIVTTLWSFPGVFPDGIVYEGFFLPELEDRSEAAAIL